MQDAPRSWLFRPAAQLGRSLVRPPANTEAQHILQPAGSDEKEWRKTARRRFTVGYSCCAAEVYNPVQALMRTVREKLHVLDTNRHS